MDLDETLKEAVKRDSVRVPPYPSTAMKLQQVMAKPDYATADLVAAMRTDAVFTGNLLRLANSPFYRRGDAVTSLPVAVSRIGGKELSRLALAATVSSAAASAGPLAELRRLVWRQSLTSALVCEALAQVEGADAGEAFVAGLLHDAGKLLVLGCLEDALAKAPGVAVKAWSEWLPLLEAHHVGFGLTLATKWQLPEALTHVIEHHHAEPAPDAACARVSRADVIVALLEENATLDAATLAARTGLSPNAAERLAERIPSIPATIAAFEAEAQAEVAKPKPVVETEAPLRPPEVLEPVALIFEVRSAGAPLVLDVRSAGEKRFVALAKAPLQVNRLVEFHVTGEPLSLWAVVQRARKLGEVFELDCGLFAMSAEVAAAWQRLRSASSANRDAA
ncbi:MAG: HDOD domain-containing protein [Myxococcaceae bacterium]|nr:HDOD domain-containing protein [Myxococcaceae bacterium]